MSDHIHVWDGTGAPMYAGGRVLLWSEFAEDREHESIPGYLEDNAGRLRTRFLAFVHELGESRVREKRLIEHLELDEGFSFWWMNRIAEKSPFKSPEIYDCLRLLALEELLLQRIPASLSLYTGSPDLLDAVRYLCRALGIRFFACRPAPAAVPMAMRRAWFWVAIPFTALAGLARFWYRRHQFGQAGDHRWFSGDGTIAFFSYFAHLDAANCAKGEFHSRQWGPLPDLVARCGLKANWIHHFVAGGEAPTAATATEWVRAFNRDRERQGSHAFLDHYLDAGVALRVLRRWLQLQAVAMRLGGVAVLFRAPDSSASLWPLLRRQWRTSLRGPVSIGSLLFFERLDAALRDMPRQTRGFYLCENQAWERALLHLWRKHGHGEIVGVIHASVPYWHLYYHDDPRTVAASGRCSMPLPDLIAANGPVARDAFAASGYGAGKIAETEALRYLDMPTAAETPGSGERAHNGKVSVLIIGDIVPESNVRLIATLLAAISRIPLSYAFTFKPHPALDFDRQQCGGISLEVTTAPLADILPAYDVVVAANGTTGALDAFLAGLPVIVGLDGSAFNLSPLRAQNGVRFAASAEEMADALIHCGRIAGRHPPPAYYWLNRSMPRWRKLLSCGPLERRCLSPTKISYNPTPSCPGDRVCER